MIYMFLSILFIILEAMIIAIFVYFVRKNRSLISASTTWYIIPVAILAVLIYCLGYYYNSKSLRFEEFGKCIENTANLFIYSFKTEDITKLLTDNSVYQFSYYAIALMAIFTSTTAVLGLCKNAAINFFRVSFRKLKGTDIVVGYGPKALEYVRNNKNSILWIHKPIQLNKDFILKSLYIEHVPYVMCVLNKKNIKSFIWRSKKDYNFIFFKENNSLEYNEIAKMFKSIKFHRNVQMKVYIEAEKNEISYINNQIAGAQNDAPCLVFSFDLYEKMANRFNWENTIAENLPSNFINDDGTIGEDKEINVVFLGYGKVNSALFKALILNNQFVVYKKDHYEAKPVHYHLFDNESKKFDDLIISRLAENYFCKDNKAPFAKIEKLCELEYENQNVWSKKFHDKLKDIIKKENSFTMVFVGFDEDLVNVTYSKKLIHDFREENVKVFCNVDNMKNIYDIEKENMKVYGQKSHIFSHDWIINDRIIDLAIRRNIGYEIISGNIGNIKKWENLSYIKKASNIYSVLNLKFKLNLMGLDISEKEENLLTKKEYKKVYLKDEEIPNDYSQYFLHNLRCTLGFIEKLRWNAFYYLNGYDTLPPEECYKNGIKTEDVQNKLHAYLLSVYGIDDLHRYILKNHSDKDKTLMDVEKYNYDYAICDNLMDDLKEMNKIKFQLGVKKRNKE